MKVEKNCPKCASENIYQDGALWICPECSNEWSSSDVESTDEKPQEYEFKDAHGNILKDGDSIVVIKDLKVKGSSSVVKVGTKVKNIRVADNGDGHDISCRIEGIGSINLKSEFVKKT